MPSKIRLNMTWRQNSRPHDS